jgi:hypothetical protein
LARAGRLWRDDVRIDDVETTADSTPERRPREATQVLDDSCSFDVALHASGWLLRYGVITALATCLVLLA